MDHPLQDGVIHRGPAPPGSVCDGGQPKEEQQHRRREYEDRRTRPTVARWLELSCRVIPTMQMHGASIGMDPCDHAEDPSDRLFSAASQRRVRTFPIRERDNEIGGGHDAPPRAEQGAGDHRVVLGDQGVVHDRGGESFADWINASLGVGLNVTAIMFTVVLAVVLGGWQLTLDRYKPFVYWLTVVLVSVTGTLYTDILTDDLGVALALSTSVFAATLAVVFGGVWWAKERTLSIHSITTMPRELFYWLAILVTFALGTAAGDWTLELTGWSPPGIAVLLPVGLIVAVAVGWNSAPMRFCRFGSLHPHAPTRRQPG